ncbi:MAG: 3-deoxy-manno-octulosonate cytidylyltransferase [Candidatus Lightella neohaematopini]|nr:3-deoxy-manno-octulosonate cytidylyltransferase [Candidatus Lightella neohaematopini]MCV2528780.1 3-deoxy-manno-octulosonate cytidylyltransferase [Candidatus Lightella neohaematopini]
MSFIVIIPARLNSSRLPKKPLVNINGIPMIIHVMRNALNSCASKVIVATDHNSIAEVVKKFGGEVYITNNHHNSGTERIAEVVNYYKLSDNQIIINVQGDEPLVSATLINQIANTLPNEDYSMSTMAIPINDIQEIINKNVVKLIINKYNYAIYFTRTIKNSTLAKSIVLKHIGVYGYNVSFIKYYKNLYSPIEHIEHLEQLRVLWHGKKIYTLVINSPIPIISIDTLEDLEQIHFLIKNNKLIYKKFKN